MIIPILVATASGKRDAYHHIDDVFVSYLLKLLFSNLLSWVLVAKHDEIIAFGDTLHRTKVTVTGSDNLLQNSISEVKSDSMISVSP